MCNIGEEEGLRKYQAYRDKRKYQLSEQRYIDEFGEALGKQKYQEYRQKTKLLHTKEEFIAKYGEVVGVQKYEKHLNDCRRTLESFIEKYR